MLDDFPLWAGLISSNPRSPHGGQRLKAFLIAQSLNQIEKAYGPNNSILDNCHVRVVFFHQRRAHREAVSRMR